ncbi:MAG TPA: GIY-YIG nuclease family protein [bacterium]|nr:GIY-YIG nuclease family protein [bacterium]
MYYVYILQSLLSGHYYIGQTNNLNDRLKRYNTGQVLSTKAYRPWKLVYKKVFLNRSEAVKYEKYLKSLKNINQLNKIIIAG